MKYRVKRIGKEYYAEHSRFGIFWQSCYETVELIPEAITPFAYDTFTEAVAACDAYEALRIEQYSIGRDVEITRLARRQPLRGDKGPRHEAT